MLTIPDHNNKTELAHDSCIKKISIRCRSSVRRLALQGVKQCQLVGTLVMTEKNSSVFAGGHH